MVGKYNVIQVLKGLFLSVNFQVKDRSLIQTTDAERRMTSPQGLQNKIDSIVAKFSQGRSFVRLVDKISVWLTCLYLSCLSGKRTHFCLFLLMIYY